jgi:Bardet-Biedl syndrome 5 protein
MNVEDMKGNSGVSGKLIITNLRIIWQSLKSNSTNLSLGFNCIQHQSIKKSSSALKGVVQSLVISAKFQKIKYEFLFNHNEDDQSRLFNTAKSVWRAYQSTRLYRELKFRASILLNGQLILLPEEEMVSIETGVWNVNSDSGFIGTLFMTNIRIVWHSEANSESSLSLSFLQLKGISVRKTKYGMVLVLNVNDNFIGFRIDPEKRMQTILSKINILLKNYHTSPIFGVKLIQEENHDIMQTQQMLDDIEIYEDRKRHTTSKNNLYEESRSDGEIVFDSHLGLAMEKKRNNLTSEQIWASLV